jgi:hypothetical protein
MARQLKRWESPRREGRNDKGRGGTARKRQRQKQLKNLAKKLKQGEPDSSTRTSQHKFSQHKSDTNQKKREGRDQLISSLFYVMLNKSGKYPAIGNPIVARCGPCNRNLYKNLYNVDRYPAWSYPQRICLRNCL